MTDKTVNQLADYSGALDDNSQIVVAPPASDTLNRGLLSAVWTYIKSKADLIYQATERRHEWAAPYDYAATAPAGTADSASGWAITRITVAADGTTTVAHATGAWTDRATLTYT